MASLGSNGKGTTVERTRLGPEVTRKQGRKGERERQMTDIKIESAKNLLANGVAPKDVAKPSVYSFPRPTAGFPHPAHL